MSSGSAEKTASTTTRRNSRPTFVRTFRRIQVATVSASSRSAPSAFHGASSGTRLASRSIRAWATPRSRTVGSGSPKYSSS